METLKEVLFHLLTLHPAQFFFYLLIVWCVVNAAGVIWVVYRPKKGGK